MMLWEWSVALTSIKRLMKKMISYTVLAYSTLMSLWWTASKQSITAEHLLLVRNQVRSRRTYRSTCTITKYIYHPWARPNATFRATTRSSSPFPTPSTSDSQACHWPSKSKEVFSKQRIIGRIQSLALPKTSTKLGRPCKRQASLTHSLALFLERNAIP